MNFFENITFRKKSNTRTKSTESSCDDENSSVNTTLDGTSNSLPNISTEENVQITELKQKIEELNMQLNSAHEEINNLSIENSELKKTISNINSKHEFLKKATRKLTQNIGTPNKNSKMSTPRCKGSQRKKSSMSSMLDLHEPNITTPTTSKSSKTQPKTIGQKVHKESDSNIKPSDRKNKLCIVSTNKRNKILSIAEKTFRNFQVCHYVSPNCETLQLIKNLDKKLDAYTMQDFCVIMIGEEDFRTTKNYYNIAIELRETIKKIQHTNIILCLPTYKLNNYSTMFNWRIVTFNNLLHLDLETYEYVTVLDSNLDLSYDFSMFSEYNGKINDHGMRNIFQNLLSIINGYPTYSENLITSAENTSSINDFFSLIT